MRLKIAKSEEKRERIFLFLEEMMREIFASWMKSNIPQTTDPAFNWERFEPIEAMETPSASPPATDFVFVSTFSQVERPAEFSWHT